jgi:hypothetical protein
MHDDCGGRPTIIDETIVKWLRQQKRTEVQKQAKSEGPTVE